MKVNLLVMLALSMVVVQSSHAEGGKFKKNHPRRAEVLGRANHQKNLNEKAEESGKITQKQEVKLNREDQRIKRQEQRDAAQNGGTITKGEQAQLNREENGVNRQRGRMEARDAAAKSAAPTTPSTGSAPTSSN